MSLLVQTKWETLELWRSPFLAYALGTIVLLTYVLTYVYGLHRVEYFSRIAFVIMPLAFGLLAGSRNARESEIAFRKMLAVMPLGRSTPFLARLFGGLSLVAAYLLLILPLVLLHAATFTARVPMLLSGMAAGLLVGACTIAISLAIASRARRRPVFAQLLVFGVLFGVLSAVAILSTGGFLGDVAMNLVPTIPAGKAADAFLDTAAPPLLALAVLALATALALVVAHATWEGWSRGSRAASAALLLAVLGSSVALAAATEFEPYSNVTSVSGMFKTRLIQGGRTLTPGADMPIGETMRLDILVEDPQVQPMRTTTQVRFSGGSLDVRPSSAELPPGANLYEVPVTLRLKPNVSASREVYVLHVVWTQSDGTVKHGAFLMHGSVQGFSEPVRWMAMLALAPLLLGGLRARGLRAGAEEPTRIRHVSS